MNKIVDIRPKCVQPILRMDRAIMGIDATFYIKI